MEKGEDNKYSQGREQIALAPVMKLEALTMESYITRKTESSWSLPVLDLFQPWCPQWRDQNAGLWWNKGRLLSSCPQQTPLYQTEPGTWGERATCTVWLWPQGAGWASGRLRLPLLWTLVAIPPVSLQRLALPPAFLLTTLLTPLQLHKIGVWFVLHVLRLPNINVSVICLSTLPVL